VTGVKCEEGELLPGTMLRQEELAFIKALGRMRPTPTFLRELRKAKAPSQKTKKAPTKKTKRATVAARAAVVATTAAPKRKAEVLSGAGASDEPASRRPAPVQPPEGDPESSGATGERAAQSSRQLGSAEGRLAYATVVEGVASPQMSSGPRMSTANSSAFAGPATSPEAAIRRLSFEDKSGPLRGMPNGATTHAQVSASSAAPVGERPNKTPIFIADVGDTRAFLAWLRASWPDGPAEG
jgi:hypothetical protein